MTGQNGLIDDDENISRPACGGSGPTPVERVNNIETRVNGPRLGRSPARVISPCYGQWIEHIAG